MENSQRENLRWPIRAWYRQYRTLATIATVVRGGQATSIPLRQTDRLSETFRSMYVWYVGYGKFAEITYHYLGQRNVARRAVGCS